MSKASTDFIYKVSALNLDVSFWNDSCYDVLAAQREENTDQFQFILDLPAAVSRAVV